MCAFGFQIVLWILGLALGSGFVLGFAFSNIAWILGGAWCFIRLLENWCADADDKYGYKLEG